MPAKKNIFEIQAKNSHRTLSRDINKQIGNKEKVR